jgi:3-hydroxyacyl-CoA dehydrogenase/enoyl-CoA hydratase/3-hydroxybutyryl-CoA epimerase
MKRSIHSERPCCQELEEIVSDLESQPPTGLVLVSGKKKSFIVGADVREFDQTDNVSDLEEQVRRVHGLFQRIEDLKFPTVVAFEGYCLGGGLELSLCFDWRIALDEDHTRIGFPRSTSASTPVLAAPVVPSAPWVAFRPYRSC